MTDPTQPGTHYPAGGYTPGGNEARKYQPAHGEQWTFPTPVREPARGRNAAWASWALCVIAAVLLVATVVWMGLQTPQAPAPSNAERDARESVQTPREQDAAASDNDIRVPAFALWAPGTRIQSTDHKPAPGESFTAQSCTSALSFTDTAGQHYAVTAGHCGRVGDLVWPTNATHAYDYAREVGHFIYSGLYSGDGSKADGVDIGIIQITDPERYMEVIGEPIPTGIAEHIPPVERVCKTGATTGYTCGEFVDTQRVQIVNAGADEDRETFGDIASVCAAAGDSGGPVFTEVNGRAVIIGVVSGTEAGRSEEECWEGMDNPKLMSYSNVEQLMTVINHVVPDAVWQHQTW
ncbi:S1 family peptidase [Corynebacterium sp. p3-SID1056]|uniref:S1 family peptidase n=1 Tax=Corynebacterium sp. p3-SID1056 TaxID=2916092 RepID=UPI0021A8DB2E|nr:S1 family peptidase [Corynebacterium sp. p3-SID1056]MCT2337994.1 S1 family peptidase [Corynebacterium sp. p3-SID1056]